MRRVEALGGLEVLHVLRQGEVFPVHFHDTFVLQWVRAGCDRSEISGHEARAGQLFVHGPGELHDGHDPEGEALEYFACYPAPGQVAGLTGAAESDWACLGTAVLDAPAVTAAAEAFFGRAQEGRAVRRAFGTLLDAVLATGGGAQTVDRALRSLTLERVREHLVRHSSHEVSTEELARVAGCSRFHLIREFKREYGITPRQYLISERVNAARRLLARGDSIANVALETGFSDQSHLNRHFKRMTACTPGQVQAARD